jgi:hypothetical protein
VERAGGTPLGSSMALMDQLYDLMSRTARSRRSSCVDSVRVDSRSMACGYHPSGTRRAGWADWTASMVTEVTNYVGDGLAALATPGFFAQEIRPLVASIEAVRVTCPLDEDSIRRAAGTL